MIYFLNEEIKVIKYYNLKNVCEIKPIFYQYSIPPFSKKKLKKFKLSIFLKKYKYF